MQMHILNCRAPSAHDLDILTSNLNDDQMEDYLLGVERKTWEEPQLRSDLAALKRESEIDSVSVWLATHFLGLYHRLIGCRIKKKPYEGAQIFNYNEQHIQLPIRVLTTVVSSLLPATSIVILYFVDNTAARLGITAFLNTSFSVALALLTDARLGEIFAATAA